MISERIQKDEYKYKLVTDQEQHNKILGDINIYVPEFMHQLWKKPKSIATILLKAERNDIKKYLGHFITHNLYDNITSLNHKDEQLIYIITLLIKEEIKSLTNINNSFFSDKRCGIILEELNKKKEVKSFFKVIILEIIKKLENVYSMEDILFNPKEISKKIDENLNNEKEKKEGKTEKNIKEKKLKAKNLKKVETFLNFENFEIEKSEFKINNDIFLDFDEQKLTQKLSECKDKDMKDFIEKIISAFKLSPNKYTNDTLKKQINNEEEEKQNDIMNYFINSFKQVIDIIDMLFDNLLNYCDLLPYSIKCICKVISILINKKFPDAIKVEKNKVLVNFFFHSLLFPILLNPSFEILINEVIITNSTIEKMQFIFLTILNNITLGKLFEQNIFTPFNWYIVEKMPKLIEFLNNICQVRLPPFIDKLLNDELPENYEYDYFKENPDEDILYRNICYNIDELNSLISNAEKFKDEITIDKKLLSKFKFNNQKLQNLRRSIQFEDIKQINSNTNQKKIINCFLLTDLIKNEKLEKNFNFDKNNNIKHFNLRELKIIQTEEDKIQNNIIRVKNFFYALLYNYPTLSEYNYKEQNLTNIINILKELNIHSYKNSSIYMDENYIPSNWYINSLIQSLPKLPQNLRNNDFEELLNEIEKEITNSIKELKLDELSIHIEYFKEIEKEKKYFENIKNIIIDIDLNKKVQSIVQNEQISLNVKTDDKNIKNITQFLKNIIKDKKDKEFSHIFKKEKHKVYNTITYFINNFPNVSDVELNNVLGMDIYKYIEEKKIPDIIENYMLLIKINLKEKKIDNEKNLEEIYNKIYDYIMEKLYNKLFPKERESFDDKIYQSCYKHIWVEFSNLNKQQKNYVFDNYLPDAINYFNQFIREKSPRKKLLCIQGIFNCIYNLGKFNGKEVDGTDDELPLLNYAFIKSKPSKMYSNCKYTEVFLGKKKLGIEGSQLAKILGICDKMINMSYKDLFNTTESDYVLNCNLSISQIIME